MAITYHAGRRIQGLSDTTLGDSGWVTSDSTYINVNTTTEKIDWDLKNDNTDDHITYNLGTALSDTLWVFRCTFRFSTASGTAQFFAGMSSTGGAQNTTQDFIGTCILTGDNQFRSVDSDGATIPVVGDNLASYSWASNTDYFLEIKRTSATAYSCTVRTGSHAGSTVATASGTCTNTTVGLQYILFANRVDSNGGSPDLTIDDILIDDGTSTYSSADYEFDFGVQANKPTNVQVGSRYEETDTRKMYHYNADVRGSQDFASVLSTYAPQFFLKLDEGSGTSLTNSGSTSGYTASITVSNSNPVWDAGVGGSNKALKFTDNVSGSYIGHTQLPTESIGDNFTMGFTFKISTDFTGGDSNHHHLWKWNHGDLGFWQMNMTNDGYIASAWYNGGWQHLVGTTDSSDNDWHTFFITCTSGSSLKGYLDGTQEFTGTANRSGYAGNDANWLGHNGGSGVISYDNAFFKNSVLTASEISSLHDLLVPALSDAWVEEGT